MKPLFAIHRSFFRQNQDNISQWMTGVKPVDLNHQNAYSPCMKSFYGAVLGIFLSWNLFAAGTEAGIGPSFKGPLGLQMYSLRFYSPTNILLQLDKVQEYGFKTIEGGGPGRGMSPDQFFKELDKRGIKLVGTGVDYGRLKSNPDAVVEEVKKLGVKYVMCSWIPHDKGMFTEKNGREAIDVFNQGLSRADPGHRGRCRAGGTAWSGDGIGHVRVFGGFDWGPNTGPRKLGIFRETRPPIIDWK
jgi:hypothetical protein